MKIAFLRIFTVIVIATAIPSCFSQSMEVAENLVNTLTAAYDTRIRPVKEQNHPISISTSFQIRSVQSFDDITGIVTFHSLMRLNWIDARMQWDAKKNGNLEEILLPINEIWSPSLVMLNSPSNLNQPAMNVYLARIASTGLVTVTSIDTLQAICTVDISNFPYDTQLCEISIVPWGYEGGEVIFEESNNTAISDISDMEITNSAWLVEGSPTEITTTKGVSTMTLTLRVTRRHSYTIINIIIPMYTLAVMNTWVFILPPESGERTSYSITVLLSFVVYMGILSDNVPKGSEPLSQLSIYLILMIFYSVSLLFWTIISLRVYNNVGKKPVPKRLQILTLYARFRCCNVFWKRSNRCSDVHRDNADTSINMKKAMGITDDTDLPMDIPETNKAELSDITWTNVGETIDFYAVLFHMGWLVYMVIVFCQLSMVIG